MTVFPSKLVMIGCGNMAGAMMTRWVECGLPPENLIIVDPARAQVPAGVTLLRELPDALPDGALITLGIKPQYLGQIAPDLVVRLKAGHVVVSMLAGVPWAQLHQALGGKADVVRVMPNTPVSLGKGVCVLYADTQTAQTARDAAHSLMQPLGLVEWIDDEGLFNLVTAVSGCGPAFLFRFVDALGAGAQALGMESGLAQRLALATVEGAAALAVASEQSPAALAEAVASPGGMTREGLNVMDEGGRLAALLEDVLRAAQDRGEALAKAAQ